MKYILWTLGFVFAHLPEFLMDGLCKGVGWLICNFPNRRIRVAYSNLSHCFPEMTEKQRRHIAYESCRRMVEMALFVVASPHLSKENLKKRIKISDYVLQELKSNAENPHPIVLMIPHFAMMETITMFPLIADVPTPHTGVFYRPFDAPGLESWVKSSRERFGIELISRKKGIMGAVKFLRENGVVAVLFDQNTLSAGVQSLFFKGICVTSQLPGILIENEKADAGIFYATRTGFWRSEVKGVRIEAKTIEDVTIAANDWLEKKLIEDETARFDWLWLHRRWRFNSDPRTAFRIPDRKSILEYTMQKKGLEELPRIFRIFITCPSSFRDTIVFLPLLRLLRKSRYDANITLLCEKDQASALRALDVPAEIIELPPMSKGKLRRLNFFKRMYALYPDIHVVLENTPLADLESRVMGAPYRFGIEDGRKRRLLTDVYKPDAAQSAEHVGQGYENMFRHFGLVGELDFSPFTADVEKSPDIFKVALICGGSGEHSWGADKWTRLVKVLNANIPGAEFHFFGDEADSRLAYEIEKNLEHVEIKTAAGRQGISSAAREIAQSDIAIATDCKLAHLANAMGVKLVALYGPTNPIRRGLVFDSPKTEILPDDCPPQGGAPVDKIDPDKVADAALNLIANSL